MIKKDLKINTESDNWNRPYLIKELEEGFEKFLQDSNQSKEMIKRAEQIDWGRLLDLFILEITVLVKKMEIPKSANSFIIDVEDIFEFGVLEYLKPQLYYVCYFFLKSIKKKDDNNRKKRIIGRMLRRAETNIKESLELLKLQSDISNLKWIKDSDTLQVKFNEVEKGLSKFRGQPFDPENLRTYGKIFEKNDEYIERDGNEEGNFRKAARNVTNKYGDEFDNLYKSFIKFKNEKHILTSKEFKNSIYQAIVDKLPPLE